ncbi:MAG: hypothetical protein ILP23_01190 [Paludibacteraceae bacterium]|nr:hypothetical protein [Paludibacteraceae bacterium]
MIKSIFNVKSVVAAGIAMFAFMTSQMASAAEVDFEILNEDGVLLSFRITNEQAPYEVELVPPHDSMDEDNKIDVVNIPAKVKYDDTEYIVTGISRTVLKESDGNVKEINLPNTFKKVGDMTVNVVNGNS